MKELEFKKETYEWELDMILEVMDKTEWAEDYGILEEVKNQLQTL